MDSVIKYKVNAKENIYFYLRVVLSLGLYFLLVKLFILPFTSDNPAMSSFYVLYVYFALIIIYLFFRFGVLIGHLKGNGIKLSKNQFPEIYQIVSRQSDLLGLKSIPDVYIIQSGGVLNAFAAKFLGRNYIVLYSEIVESAYEQDKKILEFIIGHELGHIKRNHMFKNLLLIPSYIIPFLGSAYSRACEYTCDNIGNSLCPSGVKSGLLLLASGTKIYKNVNIKEFLIQDYSEDGFWKWFSEKVSSHPNLTKRLACFINLKETANLTGFNTISETLNESTHLIEKKEEDFLRYMPK